HPTLTLAPSLNLLPNPNPTLNPNRCCTSFPARHPRNITRPGTLTGQAPASLGMSAAIDSRDKSLVAAAHRASRHRGAHRGAAHGGPGHRAGGGGAGHRVARGAGRRAAHAAVRDSPLHGRADEHRGVVDAAIRTTGHAAAAVDLVAVVLVVGHPVDVVQR